MGIPSHLVVALWTLIREAPVLAVVGLLFLILSGLGRSLGLPLLFWRTTHGQQGEKARARFLVGTSVGVLLSACSFVASLAEVTLSGGERGWFERAFVVGCAVSATLLTLLSHRQGRKGAQKVMDTLRTITGGSDDTSAQLMAQESRPGTDPPLPPCGDPAIWKMTWLLPAGGIVGILFIWILVNRSLALLPDGLANHTAVGLLLTGVHSPGPIPDWLTKAHVTAALFFAAGVLAYVALALANRLGGREIYPATAICLLLVVALAVQGFVTVRLTPGMGTVFVLLVLAYAWANGRWQRARIRGVSYPDGRATQTEPSGVALLSDERTLAAWRKQHTGDRAPVLVVVAADGGGIRAALWAASVLAELEKKDPAFPKTVRLITGASGGMLGATYWAATLDEKGGHTEGGMPLDPETLLNRLQLGGLSALASGLVFRDLLPPPLRIGRDRGRELERVWEKNCPRLENPLGTLAEDEAAGWRPSLVLTPMIVEDGRRLVISNLDLHKLLRHDASTVGSDCLLSISGVQALAVWPGAADGLRMSTAVRLQANFPFALPSTEVPPLRKEGPLCRAVDGGYYDETGVDFACAWIRQHMAYLQEQRSGVVLLQIRDTTTIGRLEGPGKHRSTVARGLDGLLTPVSGLLRARDSTTWFRNDTTVADLSARWHSAPGFFRTASVVFGGEASLSWSLTDEEANAIRGFVRHPAVRSVLDGVAALLKA